ncbi:MAG: ABC transporter ATP-binding protein, partial [Muribaculaceae bacterium]|nr:ABC transporter ATP-binding protein [Muribaculaceae bacterium]
MIELRDFSIGFGSRTLLSNVNARLQASRLTALLGRNGSGKSTLLRAMAGLNPDYSGEILIEGKDLRRMSAPERARKIAFVSTQRPRISNMICRDVVAVGRAPYTNWMGSMQQHDKEVVMQMLDAVGMAAFAEVPINRMSDGECQRVMIARALAQQTPIMLLDEPTSFLDIPNRYELCRLLRRLAEKHGKCIIFSTHELDIAQSLCDDIMLIDTPALHAMSAPAM